MSEKVARERFIRISRRNNIPEWAKVVAVASAIVFAFLLCALISTIVAPGSFGDFFIYVYQGTFYTPRITLTLFWQTAILFIIAVALTPVFKMRYWNIGAEGQCLMGVLGAVIGLYFIAPHVPTILALFIELGLAIVFAIVWAVIPAIFKAFLNTNETLFTLMMNYIAFGVVNAFVMANANTSSGIIAPLNESTQAGWLPIIQYFNNSYIANIIIVVIVAVIIWIYLRFSKHGYELSVIGGSQNTARYIGINVKKVIIRTVILTGAVCGIAGFLIAAGASHTIGEGSIGGRGFTAILICWISDFNIPLMAFYSFLISFVSVGSNNAAGWLEYPRAVSYISTAIFFIVLIASSFFLNFKMSAPSLKKFFVNIGVFFKDLFNKLFKRKKKDIPEENNNKEENK